jgi:hypothetical protein
LDALVLPPATDGSLFQGRKILQHQALGLSLVPSIVAYLQLEAALGSIGWATERGRDLSPRIAVCHPIPEPKTIHLVAAVDKLHRREDGSLSARVFFCAAKARNQKSNA